MEELVTKEVVVDGRKLNVPILVTDEGFGVNEVKDNKGVTISYEYETKEIDGIIYMIRYNNDNTETELVEIGRVAPGEDAE